jgi:hypothetical protein
MKSGKTALVCQFHLINHWRIEADELCSGLNRYLCGSSDQPNAVRGNGLLCFGKCVAFHQHLGISRGVKIHLLLPGPTNRVAI